MSKFKIITFGCKVNAYESEGFKEDLLSKGFVEAKNDEEADICIVNTCAVTSTAERKCLQAVRRMSKFSLVLTWVLIKNQLMVMALAHF